MAVSTKDMGDVVDGRKNEHYQGVGDSVESFAPKRQNHPEPRERAHREPHRFLRRTPELKTTSGRQSQERHRVAANKFQRDIAFRFHETNLSQPIVFGRIEDGEVVVKRVGYTLMVSEPKFKAEIIADRHQAMES